MTEMCNILINHAQAKNPLIQLTAIDWIREFIQLSGPKMLAFASGIFTAFLPCLAYEDELRKGSFLLSFCPTHCTSFNLFFCKCKDIRKTAQAVNNNIFELISSKEEKEKAFQYLDLDSVMKVLQQYLIQGSVDTKVAVLQWIHHLFTQAENEVRKQTEIDNICYLK